MTPPATKSGASPPTARVVRVLEHLAARPDEPRNATEIARDLGIARATCALVLEELTGSGWVVQTTRGYVLGPRLVPVGRAALASPAAGALAHDALVALADELDLVCTTSGVVGTQIVVLDRAGPSTSEDLNVDVGMRFSFAPPSGIVNVVWQSDGVVNAWLRDSPRPLNDEDLERFWNVVVDARASGVFVERLDPQALQLSSVLAGLATEDVPDALRRAIGDVLGPLASRAYRSRDLRAGRSYPVSLVAAPTFDSSGRQHLVITAFVVRADVPHAEVARIAERVRSAADQVTKNAGGNDPWT